MTLDPVIVHMLAAALAMLLLIGAVQKLRDVATFRSAVDGYALLPEPWLTVAAWGLPVAEGLAGLMLVIDAVRPAGAVVGLGVMAVVTGAIVVNLLRGRTELGCGCGGIEDEQTLSWALVARNGLLCVLLAVTLVEPTVRALSWLDFVTVGAGACCLYGIYVLANQLAANQPRLVRLRTRT